MKALICTVPGALDGLRVVDLPEPAAAAREAVVRIVACGLNFPDVLMTQGKYQFKPPLPFSPGCEFSGVVESLGAQVQGFAVGDPVCGTAQFGALAERVAVPAGNLYALPPGADMEGAAAFLYTYSTALYALRERAVLAAGDSLLVLGAGGGVGIAAVELGKLSGARVVAAASSAAKLALAQERGADAIVQYPLDLSDAARQKSFAAQLKELAGEGGFNVVCDPVGGDYSEPALRATAWEGRYLVIGFAAGRIPRLPMNLPLLKGCQIAGVQWGGAMAHDASIKGRIQRELVALFASGRLRPPVGALFELAGAAEALAVLAERRALGKVVVRCS